MWIDDKLVDDGHRSIYMYRKIPKTSPSNYKLPKLVTQKNPPLNRPSEYLYLKIALKYKIK